MTKGFRADLVPGTPVPSYFMAIMKTSTIFAVCGITCGLLSAMLGFAGNHGRPDCSDSRPASGALPHSPWTDVAARMTERYLSMTEVAERLGITKGALARYRLPDPDVVVGKARGWREDTIDRWNASRPGRGVGGGRPRKKVEDGDH